MLGLAALAVGAFQTSAHATDANTPSFSTGNATILVERLFSCNGRDRPSPLGQVRSEDGKTWTVPADVAFQTVPKAPDLYNECRGVTPSGTGDVDISAVPVMNAPGADDPSAEIFTAYFFGDNYFEFYINGKLLAVDAVPFTPFNSAIVRFKTVKPFTVAVKMVDWEENAGLGSERNRSYKAHPGDGGLTLGIDDAAGETVALTDGNWKAQTFYTGPLKDRSCLNINGSVRDSSACDTVGVDDPSGFSMAHWPIPDGWAEPAFNDATWPDARVYTNDTVGVNNKPSFTNFPDLFDAPERDARFIWSSNLILDNLVLMRRRVE